MNDSTPEAGEPTPFTERTKNLCRRHKGKIIAVCAAGLVVAAMAVKKASERSAAENGQDTGNAEGSEGLDDTESGSDPNERRKPPVKHGVSAHTRTLRDGRVIPIPPHERGGSSDDGNEDPGEAAA